LPETYIYLPQKIELVDFGATREYSKEFMDNWLRLLQAAASEDKHACIEWSLKLGYLTGEENEVRSNPLTHLSTPHLKQNFPLL
jgi:aarF domain-containing kinase